jgi:threonine dehydrogenase-like Zn-dependent dehydrogenase
MGADFVLDPTEEDFAKQVRALTEGGANVCIEVTGLGIGLIQALECMKMMGRVALLGCTRSSKFEIDYYGKVHGRGVSLIGAHTMARPGNDSSAGLWTDEDDMKAIINLINGKRLNFSDMVCEIHSPADAQKIYERAVNEKNFPVGVLFDWSKV